VSGVEWRVVYKRDGLARKARTFAREATARRWVSWLTSETYPHDDGEKFMCCSGWECGCTGLTNAGYWEQQRRLIPRLEWVKVETREVGAWHAESAKPEGGK